MRPALREFLRQRPKGRPDEELLALLGTSPLFPRRRRRHG